MPVRAALYWIFLLGVCTVQVAFSQLPSVLTRGAVFDFAVGDTFQYRASENRQLMPRFLQMAIIGKDSLPGTDSIVYRRACTERAFQPTGVQSYATVIRQWEDALSLGRLSEPLRFKYACDSSSQSDYCKDTFYLDYGSRETFSRHYNYHFALSGVERYAAGLGLCFELRESEDPGIYHFWELVYFHKKNQQWGLPQWVAVKSAPENPEIRVFPNPAAEVIYLALSENSPPPLKIRLCNAIGAPVLMRPAPPAASPLILPLEGLPAGWYFLEIYFEKNKKYVFKLFKK